jgi:ATP-dependent RNA helicase RhlB
LWVSTVFLNEDRNLKFEDLKLSAPLLTAINKLNYSDCTPIQEQAMPHLLEGKDLAGLAQTGTGKTAAFLLPIMERVLRSQNPPPDASPEVIDLHKVRGFPDWKPFHWVLILVPTRELAEQVLQNIKTFGTDAGLEGCAIYGGTSYDKQKDALKRGVTFIVATPGRLIDLYKEHNVDLKLVRAVVFDEADRMFDMGFKDDMKFILERIPKDRQFLVFSATLNLDVLNTAYQFGASPIEINVSRDQAKAENVEDSIYHLGQEEKPQYLLSLLKNLKPQQAIIFSNFKNQIDAIVQFLRNNDVPAVGISSLLSQIQRNRVIEQFKGENSTNVLVATDVAARGLDIQGVDLVVNYELPNDAESYVHRIGRTGRAGLTGKAFSFVSDKDVESLQRIEDYLKHKLNITWMEDTQLVAEYEPLRGGYQEFDRKGSYGSGPREYKGRDSRTSGRPDKARDREQPRDKERERPQGNGEARRERRPRIDGKSEGRSEQKIQFKHRPEAAQHIKAGQHHKDYKKSKHFSKPAVYKVTVWTRLVRAIKGMFKSKR